MQAFPLGIASSTLNATVGSVSLEVAHQSASQRGGGGGGGSDKHAMKPPGESNANTVVVWDLSRGFLKHTSETERGPAWQRAELEGVIRFAGAGARSSSKGSGSLARRATPLEASPSLLQLYANVGGHRNRGRGADAFCQSGRNSYGILDFEVCTATHSNDTAESYSPDVSPLRKPQSRDGDGSGSTHHDAGRQPPATASGLNIDPNLVVVQELQQLSSPSTRAGGGQASAASAHQPPIGAAVGQHSNSGASISKLFAAVAGAVKSRLLPDSSPKPPVCR